MNTFAEIAETVKKAPEARLSAPVLFNGTSAMVARWNIAARRAGMSLAAWMREAAEAKFDDQIPEGIDPDEIIPPDVTTPDAEGMRAEWRLRTGE